MGRMIRGFSFALIMVVSVFAAGCASEAPTAPEELMSSTDELGKADKIDCSLVRCALPLCEPGQTLSYQGGCCPTCKGRPTSCATVLCAAVVCADDEMAVTPKGQCCPRCVKKPQIKECTSDADCPQYYCIQCPCPYSECQGNKCITRTPDVSTCGSTF